MSNQEFVWWLGGVMAATPVDATVNARAEALEIVRTQLVKQLVQDKQLVPQALSYPPGVRSGNPTNLDDLNRMSGTTREQGIR
jgi:hypothetical protein